MATIGNIRFVVPHRLRTGKGPDAVGTRSASAARLLAERGARDERRQMAEAERDRKLGADIRERRRIGGQKRQAGHAARLAERDARIKRQLVGYYRTTSEPTVAGAVRWLVRPSRGLEDFRKLSESRQRALVSNLLSSPSSTDR